MNYSFKDIVSDSRTGLNPRKNFVLGSGNNAYITIKDIYDGKINISEKTDRVDDDAIQIIKRRSRISVGDILFVSIGRIGETAVVYEKDDSWDVNESIFIFTLNKELIIPEYFCLLFESADVRNSLTKNSSGSTFKSIKMGQLEKMEFDVPPLRKQRTIVDRINKTKAIITLRKTELQKLDELIKARFVEMFGIPFANDKKLETKKISDVVTEVRYGTSRPAVDGGKYPYLRMNNLTNDGNLDLTNLKYIDIPENEIEKCIVRKGDVLFNRTNSLELVGKTALFDLDEDMVIAGYIIRVRLKECLLPEVFAQYMNLDPVKELLHSMAKGAVNQANINAQELQSIDVYIPDINMQKEFVAFKKQVDKSKVVVQKALDEAQLLFDSLMQKYFG